MQLVPERVANSPLAAGPPNPKAELNGSTLCGNGGPMAQLESGEHLMSRRLAGPFVTATIGLLLTGAEPTVAGPEALGQRVVDDDAKRPEQAASSACETEGATFVGSKPRMLREWQGPPKKVRDVRPTYPDLPPGTRSSGMWIGEILLDTHGEVSHIWSIRQVRLTPPFPGFNNAILDAVRQWQFEPFVVESQARPLCMTVSVNINSRRLRKRGGRLTGRCDRPGA
jgi:hypothetical protein